MSDIANKKECIVEKSLENAMTYSEYRTLAKAIAQKNTTSENDNLAQYNILNDRRMHRLDKTLKVPTELAEKAKSFSGNHTWLVITESWCGDAAHALPMINKIAELNTGVDLKIVERDKHEDLMNAFLTNGNKSIPKLIAFNNDTQEIIADWGPRPLSAAKLVTEFKEQNGALTPQFKQDLQMWYNKNKGVSIAVDLVQLLN